MSLSTSACDALSFSSSAMYKTIGTYNQHNVFGINPVPVPSGVVTAGMIVPLRGNITHESLVAQRGLANAGYFTSRGAYGAGAGECDLKFIHRTCS